MTDSAADLRQRLLGGFQHGFPLAERPFAVIAARLGVEEDAVLDGFRALAADGLLTRIGAVIRPGAIGASTLAAMAVPDDRLEEVAAIVSGYPEVNHNYQREHRLNLWFVATAPDQERLYAALADMGRRCRCPVVPLPMIESYRLDLGFELQWP